MMVRSGPGCDNVAPAAPLRVTSATCHTPSSGPRFDCPRPLMFEVKAKPARQSNRAFIKSSNWSSRTRKVFLRAIPLSSHIDTFHRSTRSRHPAGRRTEEHGLTDCQSTGARDRAVDSRVVLVCPNDRSHHLWRRTCEIGIKVHHRTPEIAHGDCDARGTV